MPFMAMSSHDRFVIETPLRPGNLQRERNITFFFSGGICGSGRYNALPPNCNYYKQQRYSGGVRQAVSGGRCRSCGSAVYFTVADILTCIPPYLYPTFLSFGGLMATAQLQHKTLCTSCSRQPTLLRSHAPHLTNAVCSCQHSTTPQPYFCDRRCMRTSTSGQGGVWCPAQMTTHAIMPAPSSAWLHLVWQRTVILVSYELFTRAHPRAVCCQYWELHVCPCETHIYTSYLLAHHLQHTAALSMSAGSSPPQPYTDVVSSLITIQVSILILHDTARPLLQGVAGASEALCPPCMAASQLWQQTSCMR